MKNHKPLKTFLNTLHAWARPHCAVPLLLAATVCAVSAATLTVTSTADSGPGTLRNAIANATDGDTIDATGVSGAILLTSGELLLTKSVTIRGPGPANLAVNGNASSRVFRINTNTTVTISSLTITNGKPANRDFRNQFGGGIYNDTATLTISNCTLGGNAAVYGGGIANDGEYGSATLRVSNCTLSRNSADQDGGGIFNYGGGGSATLTISSSILTANSGSEGGGIANEDGYHRSATLEIINSTVSDNSATRISGGGILNTGALTITNSIISGNSAINLYGDDFTGGGGIDNRGSVVIAYSAISGNSALSGADYGFVSATIAGGGVNNGGMMTIINSTISDNVVVGGFYNFYNYITGAGGGIFNGGTLTVTNSTVSDNSSSDEGGGIYNGGETGGATVTIVNSTVSGNSANIFGGGIVNYGFVASQWVLLGSSILNAGASGENIFGPATSLGYNLSSDDGGGFLTNATDRINTNPMLGPLQDNGGPTFTCALLPGSPAIDHGFNFSGSTNDQRGVGFVRTSDDPAVPNASGGDGTDIGAFEVQQETGPVQQINNLIALVQGLGLQSGAANSLIVKLQAAAQALDRNNTQAACGSLGAFLNEVNAQKGKKLTAAQAGLLLARATRIRTVLNCP